MITFLNDRPMISVGNSVLQYFNDDEGDLVYHRGIVHRATESTIQVDFGDWIAEYPASGIRQAIDTMVMTGEHLATFLPGEIIRDYRMN